MAFGPMAFGGQVHMPGRTGTDMPHHASTGADIMAATGVVLIEMIADGSAEMTSGDAETPLGAAAKRVKTAVAGCSSRGHPVKVTGLTLVEV